MAQHDYNIANQGFPAFRTDLNNALSAIQTTNSGTSRPTGAVTGQLWLDTTSPTTPTLKYYDGADDISLATIDHSANTVNWLDSTVSITGLSTTATGTVLTLTDSASTSTVNLIIDNQKEIRFRETTANGTNYIALKAPASLSADLTFTLPATDGTNGQVLTTNGSGVLSFATPASGIAWQSSVKTSNFTAVAGEGYFCNTTSSDFTVTLPATPTAGQQVALVDYAGTFDTNAIIISPNGNKIEGGTNNFQLTGEREGVTLVYIDSTQGWLATSGINEGTDALSPEPTTVDFLVIAGGGGGSTQHGGGSGAGGYRNSYSTEISGGGGSSEASLKFNTGIVYTVTVGAGGTGGASGGGIKGANGSNSSISGSDITTITSIGGGAGSSWAPNNSGNSGGSGGGAGDGDSSIGTAGSGTANQGYAGNTVTANDGHGGGGGGGAGAVGSIGTGSGGAGSVAGNGGNGLDSSITGSSVTRGGGGGGGNYSTATASSGGTGGGGAGGSNGSSYPSDILPVAGTANTGGGAGCSGNASRAGVNGGSGVVILRMPTARYSGTVTGSPTVTTSGSDTIIVFNSSGSITG
jgi:hypothetical protein